MLAHVLCRPLSFQAMRPMSRIGTKATSQVPRKERLHVQSSEEKFAVDDPDVEGACCRSVPGASNAQAFEPSDRRYIVRSMALMFPSLTQRREPPGAKAPGPFTHRGAGGGTWHMDISSPTVEL